MRMHKTARDRTTAVTVVASGMAVLGATAVAQAESVTITTVKDNTLYQSFVGAMSNGAGSHCFAGRTGQGEGADLRRALFEFDVAGAVPTGATITNVTLTLHMSRTSTGSQPATLHLVDQEWGEGTSDAPGNEGAGTAATPGDATFEHTFFDSEFWTTPGGDFETTPSASTSIGFTGFYSFSSSTMTAEVQAWLDDPTTNHGWILRGNEASGVTAKRFDTRENAEPTFRPALTIDFEVAGECPADLDGDSAVTVNDLLIVLGDWGCTGSCDGDADGDGQVAVGDLLLVLGAWGPC